MSDFIDSRPIHRRQALRVLGVGMTVGSASLWAACSEPATDAKAKPAAPPAPEAPKPTQAAAAPTPVAEAPKPAAPVDELCANQGVVDDASRTMRQNMQYLAKSDKPGKQCSSCAQYVANTAGGPCGTCKLFTGPVNPAGICLAYAPTQPPG